MTSITLAVMLLCGQISPIDFSAHWEKASYDMGQFSRSYEFSNGPETFCKVLVRRDGSGIRVEACLRDEQGNAYGAWAQMIKAKTETGQTVIIFFRDTYGKKLREDEIPKFQVFWTSIPDPDVQFFLSHYPEKNNGIAEIFVLSTEAGSTGK